MTPHGSCKFSIQLVAFIWIVYFTLTSWTACIIGWRSWTQYINLQNLQFLSVISWLSFEWMVCCARKWKFTFTLQNPHKIACWFYAPLLEHKAPQQIYSISWLGIGCRTLIFGVLVCLRMNCFEPLKLYLELDVADIIRSRKGTKCPPQHKVFVYNRFSVSYAFHMHTVRTRKNTSSLTAHIRYFSLA